MFRRITVSLGWAGLLVVAACTDSPRSTGPNVVPFDAPLAKSPPSGPCSSTAYDGVVGEAQALFDGSVENNALAQLRDIRQNCGTLTGKTLGFSYLGFVIANDGITDVTPIPATDVARSQAVATHMTNLIAFDAIGSFVVPSQSLLVGGAAAVVAHDVAADVLACHESPCVSGEYLAGLHQDPLAAPIGPKLYTIYRDETISCLPTNLRRATPYCYVFNALGITPAKGFSPKLVLFICTTDHDGNDILDTRVTLGHKKSTSGAVEALTRHPSATAPAPYACSHDGAPAFAANRTFRSQFADFLAAATKMFRPTVAYAVNGGLGITDDFADGFSPLGDVNLEVFAADFNNETLGQQPATPNVGTWSTVFAESPGSITIESTLGGMTPGKFVVLDQGQGACDDCPTLTLEGTFATNPATPTVLADVGSYTAQFVSMQHKPSVKKAAMYLQAADGTQIATLSYSTEQSKKRLRFGGTSGQPSIVGSWEVDVPQTFAITVTFDPNNPGTGTVSLSINGGATVATKNFTAPNLHKIAWIFDGIDAGIVAVENVQVRRNIDQ